MLHSNNNSIKKDFDVVYVKNSNVNSEIKNEIRTFLAPNDTINLNPIYLNKYYNYNVCLELLTPDNLTLMVITVWDSHNREFELYNETIIHSYELGNDIEIPFTASVSGNHNFEFFAETEKNTNIRIKIIEGSKIFYNVMNSTDINNLLLYEINPFSNSENYAHEVGFKINRVYKFFIGKFSSIYLQENKDVRMTLIIKDSNNVEFEIYSNFSMKDVGKIHNFKFGSATDGINIINLTIFCNIDYVNIGYTIIDDYDVNLKNNEIPTDNDDSNSDERFSYSIPSEWLIGTLIFIGVLIGISNLLLLQQKRSRNNKILI